MSGFEQPATWFIVISVGIFDNFGRMSMSDHMEVIIFEGEGAPTITFNGIERYLKFME